MEKNNFLSVIKKPKIIITLIIVTIVICVTAAVLLNIFELNKEGEVTIITESSLKEVLEINQLETIEYTYNSIATKFSDKNKEMYYVAYKSTIKAGIDFNKIEFKVLDAEKKISITLPEVFISNYNVDNESLDFIFLKSKYETETVYAEAYELCTNHLKERVDKESFIKDMAYENAVSAIKAMYEPWIKACYSEYSIEVK